MTALDPSNKRSRLGAASRVSARPHPVSLGLLGVIITTLVIWRLQSPVQDVNTYVQWWRATAAASGLTVDPAQVLYPSELPLWQGVQQGLVNVPLGIPSFRVLQGFSLLCSGLAILWCWGRGNGWSAGLFALSPWFIGYGLEPTSEGVAGLLLLLGSVTPLPGRFLWLALACGLTVKAWWLAWLLSVVWTMQSWLTYRLLGIYLVSGTIALTLLASPDLIWPSVSLRLPAWSVETLSWITPLWILLSLVLIRVIWPWAQRDQALIAVAAVVYLSVAIPWILSTPLDPTRTIAFIGLMLLPLLAYVAGSVISDISLVTWRRWLGMLLLLSSTALSWQWIQSLPQRHLSLTPTYAAAEWLKVHHQAIDTPVIVDSAAIVYLDGLDPVNQLGSGAAQELYGDPLPSEVNWLVINQAESEAWSQSPLLASHPELATDQALSEWELVYSYVSESDPEITVHRWSIDSPVVRIWHRR